MPERNPSPKDEFIANKKAIDAFNDIFSRRETQLCIQTALAQHARTLTAQRVIDGTTAAANHFKLQGAHELVNILMNLGEKPISLTKAVPDNLDHTK